MCLLFFVLFSCFPPFEMDNNVKILKKMNFTSECYCKAWVVYKIVSSRLTTKCGSHYTIQHLQFYNYFFHFFQFSRLFCSASVCVYVYTFEITCPSFSQRTTRNLFFKVIAFRWALFVFNAYVTIFQLQ